MSYQETFLCATALSLDKVSNYNSQTFLLLQHTYLTAFGYLKKSKDGAFALRTQDSIKESLKELQEFAGLPVTGQLDERTKKLIKTPRCGLPDKDDADYAKRRKRFTLRGPKWPYTNLTWR